MTRGKPTQCSFCDSDRIVPIVEGDPIGMIGDLYYQRKLVPGGSFAIDYGSYVWDCADCGKTFIGPEWALSKDNPELTECYVQEVNKIIDEYEPITEEELNRLKGESFIRSLAAKFFHQEIKKFIIVGDGHRYWYEINTPKSFFKIEDNFYLQPDRMQLILRPRTDIVEVDVRPDKLPLIMLVKKIDDRRTELVLKD